MRKGPKPRLAILGGGPIGLEAGLYAKKLDLPFTIFERGRVGEHLWRWGHVRMFSPFGMNSTPLGRAVVERSKAVATLPAEDALLTGREHIAAYLGPLAETLQSNIQTETVVLKVSRRGLLKTDSAADRGKRPFRLLVRDKNKERIEEADIVLDCTGTYAQHRWLGDGGIPAVGELQAEPHIAYGLEDILGERKAHYANKTTLVVGTGYSAATTVCNLAQLAPDNQATWAIWLGRDPSSTPLPRIANDPLRERDRLAVRANNLATRDDDNVEYHGGYVVEAVEFLGPDKGFRVAARSADKVRVWEVDRVIGNVGYTPDTNLYRELQVHESYTTLGPMNLASALAAQRRRDGLPPTCRDAETLRNPEPNFYILGAKSYGRNSNFLLRVGFEQIRDVFALIMDDAKLDLYQSR
ncbi:MAG: NAD(P)-binding domain-containing protein [Gemmataceae bacterium]|nr:NAD(P)-binding domain-containing protein [Gemmataceae bacterium]